MSSQDDVREFLATRRAKITPQQAGLASYGRRRVPGLRREEVAMLAGVSTDYYARLERGNLVGVSDSVLDAIARALRLDDAETAHLYDLTRAANTAPKAARRRTPAPQGIRPSVQRVLDGMTWRRSS
jgi:transcriptional regulator with XRE-family HTH domain